MKIKYPLLLIIPVFASCVSAPVLRSFAVGDGIYQYFIPPTEWNAKDAKAKLDVTYRTGPELTTPATVNISFYGKKERPKNVSSASLNGAGTDCPLENISIILVNDDKKEYRITTQADRDAFIALLNAEPFTLKAEVDGVSYTYTPHKHFIKLKTRFLSEILLF
jgi:hypothetical protein